MSEHFYDALAPYYAYLYPDWEASCMRQAAELDRVIRDYIGPEAHAILDAACGIGTQSLGLAQLGYAVTASDISPAELERARAEAARQQLQLTWRVADMRALWQVHQQHFDVVMACDNAVPHLLSNADILAAFEQFYRCTAPEGGCLVSVRDYANMTRGGTQFNPRLTHPTPEGRLVIFDVWEFDGDMYDITMYVVDDTGQPTAQTHVIRGGRYYCVTIATLETLLEQAGFHHVQTLRDRFFQPLIVALRA